MGVGRRCVGLNVRGERCGHVTLWEGEPVLCHFHRRVNRHVAPRKVRCVGRRKDGAQCRGYALKRLADSAEPLCPYHAGMSGAHRLPPDGKRCVAMARSVGSRAAGERCQNWVMASSEEQLCDVHAGVSGWQPGAAPTQWPLPDEARCVQIKADGERCGSWAVGEDRLCNAHAGRTGFAVGNELAWHHGLYARRSLGEAAARAVFEMVRQELYEDGFVEPGSEAWWTMTAMCRTTLYGLLAGWDSGGVRWGWGVAARQAGLAFDGVWLVAQLVRRGRGLGHELHELGELGD